MKSIYFQSQQEICPEIYELTFKAPKISFQAGQFIDLYVPTEIDQTRRHREFTLVSNPKDLPVIKIAFRETGSEFKKYLLNLRDNQELKYEGPYGDFSIKEDSHSLYFLASGIGITPALSLVANQQNSNKKITIIHFDHRGHFPYHDQLQDLKQNNPNLNLDFIPLKPSEDILKEKVKETQATFYIAGSPQMVTKTKQTLENLGFVPENIFTDEFVGY